jgi:uncharacterized membrane protein
MSNAEKLFFGYVLLWLWCWFLIGGYSVFVDRLPSLTMEILVVFLVVPCLVAFTRVFVLEIKVKNNEAENGK